jgi:hypothetical protein
MRIQQQRITCATCRKVGEVEIVLDAPLSVVSASMKAARCPSCGSSDLTLGGAYPDAPPPTSPLEKRVSWWIRRGEVGSSSDTIQRAFTGRGPELLPTIPHDPDDFRRCKQLLDLIPEWRTDLARVAKIYPWWEPFVDAWPDLERLYAEEAPAGTCPKLDAAMQALVQESQRIRRAS